MSQAELPFFARLFFAWACFFKVLFDGGFAARAKALAGGEAPALPPAPPEPRPEAKPVVVEAPKEAPAPKAEPKVASSAEAKPDVTSALQLLALLQREGRFVDFVEQDVAGFPDAEIGAAARVVHEGCRKALRGHAKLLPIRKEEEGVKVTIEPGFAPQELKLTGNVQGSGPFKGTLVHRGWRVDEVSLPLPMKGHDAMVLAPAEVEL